MRVRNLSQLPATRAGWRTGSDAAEREADQAAAEVSGGGFAGGIRSAPEVKSEIPPAAGEGLRSPGQPLDPAIRDVFEPRFGHDFSRVKVHTGSRAAASARALGARAYTTGEDIVFGPGRYDPGSRSGQSLIAHELAHVVQQGRHGRPALQLKSELEDLPEDERKKVRIEAKGFAMTAFDATFLGNTGHPLPAGISVRFGASVPAARHKGLTQVVGSLVNPAVAGGPVILPKNTAFGMAIAAAGAIFRFARLDRPSLAQAGAANAPETVLVEELGPIPQKPKTVWEPGGQPAGLPPAIPMVLPEESRLKVRDVLLKRGPGWKEDDWEQVREVMNGLPEPVLKELAGIELRRLPVKVCAAGEVQAGTCDPKRAAETDAIGKTITFFDGAFVKSSTRYGVSPELQQFFIHEIGHLADYAPLGAAWKGSRSGTRNLPRLRAARSRSGSAWVRHERKGRDLFQYTEIGGEATAGTFREAAVQDGLSLQGDKIVSGGVTPYGDTSWRELFAESFALYYTDPDLLRAIRPKVYAFLEKTYPK